MPKQTYLLFCILTTIALTGCSQGFRSLAPNNTATPFVLISPESTNMRLRRVKEVTSLDYGQMLELSIGDIFVLDKLPEDNSPIMLSDGNVLRRLPNSDGMNQNQERYEAMVIGTSVLSSFVSFPCPNAPVGCSPPGKFIYVTVIIIKP